MEARLSDVNFSQLTAGRSYFPSPTHWEDEVLYFLLADRFSDGRETNYLDNSGFLVQGPGTPLFGLADLGNAVTTESDTAAWREAGARFVGGTLAGINSKLGYLARLGITAIWISPIFKQVASQETYHGYGIQNFLDVDPRFGTPWSWSSSCARHITSGSAWCSTSFSIIRATSSATRRRAPSAP